MLNFDNLLTQIDKLKRQISGIVKFFDVIAMALLLIFYALSIYLNINDLVRLIIYSILTFLTLIMLSLDIVSLFKKFQRIKELNKDYYSKVYNYSKFVIILASIIYSGYLLYTTKSNNLALSLFILSVIFYFLSIVLDVTKTIGGRIINNLLIATKMDIENNILGTALKETKFMDIDKVKPLENEDKIREKIKKETEIKNKDKVKENKINTADVIKTLLAIPAKYKTKTIIKNVVDEDAVAAFFKKQSRASRLLFMQEREIDRLLHKAQALLDLQPYQDHKADIVFVIAYVKERKSKTLFGNKLTLVAMAITTLKLLQEYTIKSEYEPFLLYAIKTLKDN